MNLPVFIDSWVITDGNYPHFSEGETRQFALNFWAPRSLEAVEAREPILIFGDKCEARALGRVLFSTAEILVIDFGVLAYSEGSADLGRFCVGDFVAGDIRLAVDPFFYFERLSKLEGVPSLIYEWRIESIKQDTTPLILGEGCGRQVWIRDESRVSFAPVESTAEVIPSTNDVAGSYVMQCTKLETTPMKQFSRPQWW